MTVRRQVARLAFQHTKEPEIIAQQWARRQARAGLLTLQYIAVHPELKLHEPLLEFHPGDPLPNFDALAWQVQSRWKLPPEMTLVATATKKARQFTGGVIGGRPIRHREVTHDVHVASVYLRLRETDCELSKRWMPEDAVYATNAHEFRTKVPDAVLTGKEPLIVEFAGKYSARKLRSLHAEYSKSRYQLW
jgi:hypothetical protein